MGNGKWKWGEGGFNTETSLLLDLQSLGLLSWVIWKFFQVST